MRELHWHPNSDELQYYIAGQARMTVFASNATAGTFDYQGGDVGYVPRSMPHYIENTGTTALRYLELWKTFALLRRLAGTVAGVHALRTRAGTSEH